MSNYSLFKDHRICLLKYIICCAFLAISISGCAGQSPRYYFYEGNPRSSDKVATVVLYGHIMMISLNNIPLAEFPRVFDVSPGKYAFDIIYMDTSEQFNTRTSYSGRSNAMLQAQSGHIYYLYPLISKDKNNVLKWEPKVVDFEKIEDLLSYSKGYWDTSREDGKKIKDRVEQHYQKNQSHSLSISERKQWE